MLFENRNASVRIKHPHVGCLHVIPKIPLADFGDHVRSGSAEKRARQPE